MDEPYKNIPELATFLSPKVRHLLLENGNNQQCDEKTCREIEFIKENLTFDWKKVESLFEDLIGDNFTIDDQPETWFEATVEKLWPVYIEAHHVISCQGIHTVSTNFWELCFWTAKQDQLMEYHNLFNNFKTSTIEVVLFITSVLEHSLGNIFLMKGKNVPALLRDLLVTPELLTNIGFIPILFLQILMGTPLALNLRNVAWHGFLQPEELPRQLVSTLFLVVASVGELLSKQSINLQTIPMRTQIYYSPDLFEGCFPPLNDSADDVLRILANCPFVDSFHYLLWESAMLHFINFRYGQCLQLLLPQFEHMLRCIFCFANNCPERTLTAESTTLYITMSEIVAEHYLTSMNNIQLVLGDTGIEMLYDIFVHQSGPRIRDKISHGESDLRAIPRNLTNHIISVASAIALEAGRKRTSAAGSQTQNSCDSLIDKLISSYQNYISRFHASSLVKESIVSVLHHLDDWESYPTPDGNIVMNKTFNDGDELHQLHSKLLIQLINKENAFDIASSETILECVLSMKIKTVFRPKQESEVLSIVRQIVENMKLISDHIEEQLRYKFYLYSHHEMRSRQRNTYQRMLFVVPYLNQVIQCIVLIAALQLCKINSIPSYEVKVYQGRVRFLKQVLQFVENISSLTSKEKNRWEETNSLAEKFVQNINQLVEKKFLMTL